MADEKMTAGEADALTLFYLGVTAIIDASRVNGEAALNGEDAIRFLQIIGAGVDTTALALKKAAPEAVNGPTGDAEEQVDADVVELAQYRQSGRLLH